MHISWIIYNFSYLICCSVVLFKLVVSMEWLLHSLLEVGEFPWWAIPLYTVCKSFWEPSKWKALYKYTLPPAASRLSTGDAFASLMYIVFHLGHCFYFYDHKRNIHSMNNNVNCIQENIYLYIFLWFKTKKSERKAGMTVFFPVAVCFFIALFIIFELYGGILLKRSSLSVHHLRIWGSGFK